MTLKEMQVRVKEKLREFGFPGFIAGIFARKIPKLKRRTRTYSWAEVRRLARAGQDCADSVEVFTVSRLLHEGMT